MSDEGTMELTAEDKMAATYAAIMKIIILCCIGWLLFVIGFINVAKNRGDGFYVLVFGGMIIAAFPMLRRILSGGIGAMFATPDNTKYYNVYASGRKERDYSTEATMGMLGLFLKFIGLLIVLFIGIVATFIHLLILLGKYIYYYRLANPKPPFAKSAFALYVAGVVFLVGAVIIVSVVDNTISSIETAQGEKFRDDQIKALPAFPFEATIVVYRTYAYSGSYISEKSSSPENYKIEDRVEIPKDAVITVKGIRKEGDFTIEYEGQELRFWRINFSQFEPVK